VDHDKTSQPEAAAELKAPALWTFLTNHAHVLIALAQDPAWAGGAEGFSREEAARMLVMIAGVPIRFELTATDFDPVEGISTETLGSSLALLHDLLRKLS